MKVRDVFKEPIDRHIAPVVYFHEQDPARIADEVAQYIFTPGIHDEMVRLLGNLAKALGDPDACDHPAAWISGFYGSGKSSFAKLLGLSLDGRLLPDGRLLSEALLDRDDTPDRSKLRDGWGKVAKRLPKGALSVVFDIGAEARDNEHVDKAALRCLRRAVGYCPMDPVAVEEMKLEKAGRWEEFLAKAQEVLGRPWSEASEDAFAMEDFSEVAHHLFPTKYTEPMSWHFSHTGRAYDARGSVQDSISELRQILDTRAGGKHVFFVIDEVSQYIVRPGSHTEAPVHEAGEPIQDPKDRMLRLQSFISALGKEFRGRVWLFSLGQEQLDQAEKDSPLWKLRARFPEPFRVHLDAANIRDVVKRRLLRKKEENEAVLRAAWRAHESRLKLYAWKGETANESDFLDTYPLMPGHVEILLETGSGLRAQSPRVQADAASVRGLLQLVQEVFRNAEVRLADAEVPALLTFDQVYEVQRSGLPNDKSLTMQAIFNAFPIGADPRNALVHRVAKVICLMGYQARVKVDEERIAQLLYGDPGAPSLVDDVRSAVAALKDENFLNFSEAKGYRLQDAAGKEWEAERRNKPAGAESVSQKILEQVQDLFVTRANLGSRTLPVELMFTAPPKYAEHRPKTVREETTIPLDLRFVGDALDTAGWTRRSGDAPLKDRFLWVVPYAIGDDLFELAEELTKSRAMVDHYGHIRTTLPPEKVHLLIDEESRAERLAGELKDRVKARLHLGNLFFREGRAGLASQGSVEAVIKSQVEPRLRDLYPYHLDVAVSARDMEQLLAADIPVGASQKFFQGPNSLGFLKMDAGRPVWAPEGEAPRAILRQIEELRGMNGGALLQTFARPPYGYPGDIVRACVLALLRAERIVITTESGRRLTNYKDEGARDLFLADRPLRNAEISVNKGGKIGGREKVAIRTVLEAAGERALSLDSDVLTDAIFRVLSVQRQRLRDVEERLRAVPTLGEPLQPELFTRLAAACEKCGRDRSVEATLVAFYNDLDVFRDGFALLAEYHRDLTDDAIRALRDAHDALTIEGDQLLRAAQVEAAADAGADAAREKIRGHLSGSRPWRDFADLAAPVATLRGVYIEARSARSARRESDASEAREILKREPGYDTLLPEVAAEVLVPLVRAGSSVEVGAVAPTLVVLDAEWPELLRQADAEARERLHRALHPKIPVHDVVLPVKVLKIPDEVEAWIKGVRTRLLSELGTEGRRHVRVKGA